MRHNVKGMHSTLIFKESSDNVQFTLTQLKIVLSLSNNNGTKKEFVTFENSNSKMHRILTIDILEKGNDTHLLRC